MALLRPAAGVAIQDLIPDGRGKTDLLRHASGGEEVRGEAREKEERFFKGYTARARYSLYRR